MTSTAARVPTAARNCLQLASTTANIQKRYRVAGPHLRDARWDAESATRRALCILVQRSILAPVRIRQQKTPTRRVFGPQPYHLYALHCDCYMCSISAAGFCGGVWMNFCFHAIALRLTGRSLAASPWTLWETCWTIRRRHIPGRGPATLHSFYPCRQGLSESPCMHVQTYPPYHISMPMQSSDAQCTLLAACSASSHMRRHSRQIHTQAGCACVAHRRRGPSTVPSIRSRVCRACVASGCAAPACAA